MALNSHSAMFSQLPLGCVAEHDAANQRPRPLRLKPFVESAFGVRVEVVPTWEHAA